LRHFVEGWNIAISVGSGFPDKPEMTDMALFFAFTKKVDSNRFYRFKATRRALKELFWYGFCILVHFDHI